MDQHEQRGFADYAAGYRKFYKTAADARSIGEGWMRGAAADASGASALGVVLHYTGGPVPPRAASGVVASAAYGAQRFRARFSVEQLPVIERQRLSLLETAREDPVARAFLSGDARDAAGGFI